MPLPHTIDQAVTCHHVTGGRNRGSSAAAALMARTRKVTFLVPASATPGFLSQIAALQLALRRLPWTRWQADIVVCFGGRPGLEATFQLSRWLPYLADVTMVFPRERATDGDYDGQIDELYRAAPADADVLVRADADVLPVANLEPLLDFVLERSAIAGVTAHYRFPAPPGVGNREAWDAVAEGFLAEPLRFEHSYALVTPDVSQEEQACPFYLNDGFVAVRTRVLRSVRAALPRHASAPRGPPRQPVLRGADRAGSLGCANPAAVGRSPVALQLPERSRCRRAVPGGAGKRRRLPLPPRGPVRPAADLPLARDVFGLSRPAAPPCERPLPRFGAHALRRGVPVRPPTRAARRARDEPRPEKEQTQTAASASLTAEQALLGRFRETGALEPLMKAKQSLVARFGVEDGWRRYKELLGLPPTARIRYATLAGQGEYARRHGTRFVETFAGGAPFRVEALPVLDGATSPATVSRARSTHLARLEDVFVREASAAIVTDHHALLDFEDAELDMFDCEFDIDPSFFSASRHSAWVVTAEDDPTCLQIDEAFTLLGPHLGAFGDFMMQYLPRYLWADMSGELPHVPVLSSSRLPQTIRDAIRLVVPADVEIIEVDPLQPVHVRRLWCGSNLTYAPAREVMDERYSTLHTYPSPELIVPVVSELNRRVAPHVVRDRGSENVFLARQPWRWAHLVNASRDRGRRRRARLYGRLSR